MKARAVILAVALLFTCAMAFATVYVMLDQGPDIFTFFGVLITLIFAIGILGALTERD